MGTEQRKREDVMAMDNRTLKKEEGKAGAKAKKTHQRKGK